MHPFAKTAPEITTATAKQVAEIVKHSKKSRWTRIFCRRILDTRIERCCLLGDFEQESVYENFLNNAFS
jgi:hypothetical protein